MNIATYSPDYATARDRFCAAAQQAGWRWEAHPVAGVGPSGEPLTVDVAISSSEPAEQTLIVSSGLHGVEGFFGSAVQLALLDRWKEQPPSVRCVLLHGLNPYGFAWLRRFDEHNVDPNRNFLLAEEAYRGAPPLYAKFASLLNPQRPPSRWDLFEWQALGIIARYGVPALRQAVACGQYDFPQGIFYGGAGPATTQRLLQSQMKAWLGGSRQVVHLDFHTGLGRHGAWKLLIDYALPPQQRAWLVEWFGAAAFETYDATSIAYDSRGSIGRWCQAQSFAASYLYACAEFGTYPSLRMLSGIRAENQAHHWSHPDVPATQRAKARLKELFCPADARWRAQVLQSSLKLIEQAALGLAATPMID